MSDITLKLLSCGILGLIGYILWLVSKIIVTAMICKNPELSDDKVKYLTNMITKNKHRRFN